jgi:hypothetical protein
MIPESSRSGTCPPDRAALYVVSLFFQDGRGLSPLGSGLSTFPEALGVMAGAQLASRALYPVPGRHGHCGQCAVLTPGGPARRAGRRTAEARRR